MLQYNIKGVSAIKVLFPIKYKTMNENTVNLILLDLKFGRQSFSYRLIKLFI